MAEGHDDLSSMDSLYLSETTQDISIENDPCESFIHCLQPDETKNHGLQFDKTKKQFKWHGKANEVVKYVEGQLCLLGTWSVKNGGNLHVFKSTDNTVTINWYCSTSTLQVQGPSRLCHP